MANKDRGRDGKRRKRTDKQRARARQIAERKRADALAEIARYEGEFKATDDTVIKRGDLLAADHPWGPGRPLWRVRKATDPKDWIVGVALATPGAREGEIMFVDVALADIAKIPA